VLRNTGRSRDETEEDREADLEAGDPESYRVAFLLRTNRRTQALDEGSSPDRRHAHCARLPRHRLVKMLSCADIKLHADRN